jgi:alpha-L-fucosidase
VLVGRAQHRTHGRRRRAASQRARRVRRRLRRADLVFGTYYSLLDWSDPRYPSCEYVEQVVHPHVLDLVDRYGSQMLWGDGHWGGGGSHWRSDEMIDAARERNPSIVVNDGGGATGRVCVVRVPPPADDRRRTVGDAARAGRSFGYNRAERAEHLMSPRAIVTLLTEVLAKGGHLLLAVGPDATGRIPTMQVVDARQRASGSPPRATSSTGRRRGRSGATRGPLPHARRRPPRVDVDGAGRFAALGRDAGHVRSVTASTPTAHATIGFEQSTSG